MSGKERLVKEDRSDYKKTKFGWIPEDWEICKFGEIIIFSQYGLSKYISNNGNYPIFKMNNFKDGKIIDENLDKVRISNEEFKEFKLNKRELLFNRTNSYELVGKTGIFDLDGNYVFASYLVRFRIDESKADPYFVNYFLNSDSIQKRLKAIATKGVSQVNINPSNLKNWLKIPLPPLPEQKKIAEILSTWDEAIDKTRALIAAKEKLKKALMQQLLTGKRRFKEFENNSEFKQSKIGKIPKNWELKKAKEIFETVSIKNIENEELLAVTQNTGVIPRRLLDGRVMMPEGSTKSYKLVEPGDFVISLRTFQGGIEFSEFRGIVSPAYTVLKPKIPVIKPFFKYYFKSSEFISRLAMAIIGIRDGKQVSVPDFMLMKLRFPPLNEQKKISSVLENAEKEIDLLNKKLDALQRQKKGLMQVLLTGKVRVKV